MLVDNQFFDKFATFFKTLTSNQREQFTKILKIIDELKKKGKVDNKIIKKMVESIIKLVETKLFKIQNSQPSMVIKDKDNSIINYDKIDKIITKNKNNFDLNEYKKSIESLITSLKKLNVSFKNYLVKTASEEYINSEGDILKIIPNIINHLTKLYE